MKWWLERGPKATVMERRTEEAESTEESHSHTHPIFEVISQRLFTGKRDNKNMHLALILSLSHWVRRAAPAMSHSFSWQPLSLTYAAFPPCCLLLAPSFQFLSLSPSLLQLSPKRLPAVSPSPSSPPSRGTCPERSSWNISLIMTLSHPSRAPWCLWNEVQESQWEPNGSWTLQQRQGPRTWTRQYQPSRNLQFHSMSWDKYLIKKLKPYKVTQRVWGSL